MFLSFNLFAQTPKLSNFRVEDSNKTRVYFDVEGDISGLTIQGFTISGKNISSINTSSNYFTVSSAFDFWDNNTIRLINGIGVVYDFDLQYIQNNISEPLSETDRYVSVNGSGARNGASQTDEWTLQEPVSNATASAWPNHNG